MAHLQVSKDGEKLDPIKLGGPGTDVVLGRNSKMSDILLEHPSISRRHAAILREASGQLVLVDLASKAGVSLNGRRIPPSVGVPLAEGSEITFGGSSRTRVMLLDPDPDPDCNPDPDQVARQGRTWCGSS